MKEGEEPSQPSQEPDKDAVAKLKRKTIKIKLPPKPYAPRSSAVLPNLKRLWREG